MADEPNNAPDTDDLGLTDPEAQQLLAGDQDEGEQGSSDSEGTDWESKADYWKKMSRKNEDHLKKKLKEAENLQAKIKEFESANLSESQKLQQDRDSYKSRAERAEAAQQNWSIAVQVAEELELDASIAQLKAVAKRISGDSEENKIEDAQELFALLAPKSTTPKVSSRPKEKLRGGSDPDNEPDETDPAKLAALIPRAR